RRPTARARRRPPDQARAPPARRLQGGVIAEGSAEPSARATPLDALGTKQARALKAASPRATRRTRVAADARRSSAGVTEAGLPPVLLDLLLPGLVRHQARAV